ncbi:hypothetical protein [uncultured Tenacibaculum sp.]|uniref:hypothetical protein n=1 Tax=uncultured Tenacibaculum sp. TaxID=174713 RepID=UPI002629105A|nr:hypothetical protein [uncultured Tenacibaculum sp.]
MITNAVLVKKLNFKSVDKQIILELIKSEEYFKKESTLSNEELVHLIRLQVSN